MPNEEPIKTCEIAGPKIAKYLEQDKSKTLKSKNWNDTYHHEDNPTHIAMFTEDYTTIAGTLFPISPLLEESTSSEQTLHIVRRCVLIGDFMLEVGQ